MKVLEKLRLRVAAVDALPQLAVLGLCVGLLSGSVIILFRKLIELTQQGLLPGNSAENYEGLAWEYRLLLPIAGALLLGALFQWLGKSMTRVGVVHVMERLAYHQGHLPLRNALVQFIGAAVSIVSGHSVGREGPGIHLGAAAGSQLGQLLGLPNNTMRILVACGVAAAIAASFNTPIAGVIFAMEVVMMEYTISGFTPVILAAVGATALTRAVFGTSTAFIVPPLDLVSLWELPYIVLLGLVIGTLSAIFIHMLNVFTRLWADRPDWQRLALAGVITGVCALAVPQIMGIGYDTVSATLLSQTGLWIMLGVVLFKLLATAAGLGLGLPGGLIGPTLVIGATAGGAMGLASEGMFAGQSAGFYAMLGMGAMMGATLQAPLAALMAMLELTANPNIILPGMLAVIASGMTSSEVFRKNSVYHMLMRARGLDYHNDPVAQSLRRVGVASIMNRNFATGTQLISRTDADCLVVTGNTSWIIVEQDREPVALLPAMDVARHLAETSDEQIDLLEIPAQRRELAAIHFQATLQEAIGVLEETKADALYVWRPAAPGVRRIYGVLTRQDIEAAPLHQD